MDKYFFSILVPVYNVEKYLVQCLDSVLNQTVSDFEVILIDDGSTDNSGNICDIYSEKDSRFKTYHQENRGLLLTRRTSISKAQGKYILFLDSDDYWEKNLLETVFNTIQHYKCDLVLFRFNRITDDGDLIKVDDSIFLDNTVFDLDNKETLFKKFIDGTTMNSIWSKAVYREIIDIDEDYTKYGDKKGEDILQSMPLIYNATKIVYLNKSLYNYRYTPSSRTSKFKPKYFKDYNIVRNVIYDYMNKMGYNTEENKKLFYQFYNQSIVRYTLKLIISNDNNILIKETLDEAKKEEFYLESLKYVDKSRLSLVEYLCMILLQKNKYYTLIFSVKLLDFCRKKFRWIKRRII